MNSNLFSDNIFLAVYCFTPVPDINLIYIRVSILCCLDRFSAFEHLLLEYIYKLCGTKLLRVLMFGIFAIFPAIRSENKLPQTFFPQKFTPE